MRFRPIIQLDELLFGCLFGRIRAMHHLGQVSSVIIGEHQFIPIRFTEFFDHHRFIKQIFDIIRAMCDKLAIFSLCQRNKDTRRRTIASIFLLYKSMDCPIAIFKN